jgi:hypothetical protein
MHVQSFPFVTRSAIRVAAIVRRSLGRLLRYVRLRQSVRIGVSQLRKDCLESLHRCLSKAGVLSGCNGGNDSQEWDFFVNPLRFTNFDALSLSSLHICIIGGWNDWQTMSGFGRKECVTIPTDSNGLYLLSMSGEGLRRNRQWR